MIPPPIASGLLRICVQKTTAGDCGATNSSTSGSPLMASFNREGPSAPLAVPASGGTISVIADPRIGDGEQQIGDEVADDEDERCHQNGAHDEVLILREDRIERDA